MIILPDENGACTMLATIWQAGNDTLDRPCMEIIAELHSCNTASLADIEIPVVHIQTGGIMKTTHQRE
jgi:hypothetical protein